MPDVIYLDNAATTRVAPEVRAAMAPWLGELWGNPSSAHRLGLAAGRAVKESRRTLADALGCAPEEVVFTSGGTEADSLAVFGVAAAARRPGHLIVSAIEHPAVLESARALEARGWRLDLAPVDGQGRVDPDEIAGLVGEDTALVSVMHVNNEVGTVQPIAELVRAVRRRSPKTRVHTDAVQSFTKEPTDVDTLGVDLLSLSSHKVHGPMGAGALYVRKGTRLGPLFGGGGQEGGHRPGTENLPGIVGLAAAARLGTGARPREAPAMTARRDRLWEGLRDRVEGVRLNGPEGPGRVCHNLHVSVPRVESQPLLHALEARGVLASAGSACHAQTTSLSHVLAAIGLQARGEAHLRLSLSRETTDAEVEAAVEAFAEAVADLLP